MQVRGGLSSLRLDPAPETALLNCMGGERLLAHAQEHGAEGASWGWSCAVEEPASREAAHSWQCVLSLLRSPADSSIADRNASGWTPTTNARSWRFGLLAGALRCGILASKIAPPQATVLAAALDGVTESAADWEPAMTAGIAKFTSDDGATPMYASNASAAMRLVHLSLQGMLALLEHATIEWENVQLTLSAAVTASRLPALPLSAVAYAVQLAGVVAMHFANVEANSIPTSAEAGAADAQHDAAATAKRDMLRNMRDDALVLLALLLRPRFPVKAPHTSSPSAAVVLTSEAAQLHLMATLSSSLWPHRVVQQQQPADAPRASARRSTSDVAAAHTDPLCLFASSTTTGTGAPSVSGTLSRTNSGVSLRSSADTSSATGGRGSCRDALIRVLSEAFSGPWCQSVEALSCLARLLLGAQQAPGAADSAAQLHGAGPDRRATSIFGSHSLSSSLEVVVLWSESVHQRIAVPMTQCPAVDSWRLRLQADFCVGPLLKDVITCPMTAGLFRDWSGLVHFTETLCSAHASHHDLLFTDEVRRGEKDGEESGPQQPGPRRGVSFANGPSAAAAKHSSMAHHHLNALPTASPSLTATERRIVTLITAPVLTVVVQLAGACRAIMAAGHNPSMDAKSGGDATIRRRAAVATVLPRACADARTLALWSMPGTAPEVLTAVFSAPGTTAQRAWSIAVKDEDMPLAAVEVARLSVDRYTDWIVQLSDDQSMAVYAFNANARLVAAVCHGTSVVPGALHRFISPALLVSQPTALLPSQVVGAAPRLALRASDVERWAVLCFVATLSRLHAGLRAAVCNLAAVRPAMTTTNGGQGKSTMKDQMGAVNAWQLMAVSAVVGSAVLEHSPERLRGTHAVTTLALQPMHVAPEQRVVERVFVEIAVTSSAGLLRRSTKNRRADAAADDSDDGTDEESELVLQSEGPAEGDKVKKALIAAAMSGKSDAPDDVSTQRSFQGDMESHGSDAGHAAEGLWTPMLCAHWLADTCVRWCSRARVFNDRDCVLSESVSPEVRSAFVAAAALLQSSHRVPVQSDAEAMSPFPGGQLPWYRSIDVFHGIHSHARRRNYMFELRALPHVFAVCINDVVRQLAPMDSASKVPVPHRCAWGGLHASVVTNTNTDADALAADSSHTVSNATVPFQIGANNQRNCADDDAKSSLGTGSALTALTQRQSAGGSGSTSRKHRAALIEQLTLERDALRDDFGAFHTTARIAESRAAALVGQVEAHEETIEQQYCRLLALSDALLASRAREAESRATIASAYAMLEREQASHDAAVRQQASVTDDLLLAREATRGLEERLFRERHDADAAHAAAERDMAALARRVDELENQNATKDQQILALEAKLQGFLRLSAAIGGLADQFR